MSAVPIRWPDASAPRLRVDYVACERASPQALLARDDALAVFGFGDGGPAQRRPALPARAAATACGARAVRSLAHRPVRCSDGRDGEIALGQDGALQFGVIEVDEGERRHRGDGRRAPMRA